MHRNIDIYYNVDDTAVVRIERVIVVGGGQSGLAAARALRDAGLHPVVLEARDRPAGSWPDYYDSLTVFSPAGYSAMPGLALPGDPDRYPVRDEIVEYLQRYAGRLGIDLRTDTTVESVHAVDDGYEVHTAGGQRLAAAGVVAASGSFANPYCPPLDGLAGFAGEVSHVAGYRNPHAYAGKRVVIIGGGNSAVQIGYELARTCSVTLASRKPVRFVPQRPLGRDVHFWLGISGLDTAPLGRWLARPPTQPVLDDGRYRAALAAGRPDRRPLPIGFDDDIVTWPDGTRERVDALLLATGYRPHLPYLHGLGALDGSDAPRHVGGLSTTHRGLGYVGLEYQRSHSSNTLRGVSRDAEYVAAALAGRVTRRPARPSPGREGMPRVWPAR